MVTKAVYSPGSGTFTSAFACNSGNETTAILPTAAVLLAAGRFGLAETDCARLKRPREILSRGG